MKRNRMLSVLAFSALTFGMLTSCGGASETMTDQEIVEAVIKDSSILLDNKTNPMRPTTYPTAYNELTALTGGYLKATTDFTYLSEANIEHQVSINWTYEASQWKVTDQETFLEMKPKYDGNIESNGTGKFTISAEATLGDAKATATYEINLVNDKNYVTIKDMPTSGDVAVQGYVTGIIKDTDGNGTPYGLYVQDGEYALMVYKPAKSVTDTLQIGDAVEVLGAASAYNNVKQITGSGAVITKLADDEIREGVEPAAINELEDADNIAKFTDHYAAMYKITGAKVIECSIDANVYNGKETKNAYVTAVVRYKGKEITISSDRYNADYDDKLKFYNTLKEIKDSNGAKTLDYVGPIATVNVYDGLGSDGNTKEKKVPGFSFIDSSFATVNNNAYVPVSSINLKGEKSAIRVGETTTLEAEVIDLENTSITWSSSDTSKATVSNEGVVTGVAAGEVTITATSVADANVKAAYTLNIAEKLTLAEVYTKTKGAYVEFDAIYTGEYRGDQNSGFYVGDGDYGMYIYKGDAAALELTEGTHVNVLGKVDVYNGGFQIANADVKKLETSSAVTPTTLELKDNLTGVDGKDTGRKVSVTGTLKEDPKLDSYENITLTITLGDGSDVNLKADSRYVPSHQLEALKVLKGGSTVTVNGFVTFNVSKSETLPTDSKGLQIVALSVPGIESNKVSITNAILNGGTPNTGSSNSYASFDNLNVDGITFKGDLGTAGYGDNSDPIIAMRTKVSNGEIANQSYLTNTSEFNGFNTFEIKYNATSITQYAPVLPLIYFSESPINTLTDMTAANWDKEPETNVTTYTTDIPETAKYFYLVHPGTATNKLFTYYFDSISLVK